MKNKDLKKIINALPDDADVVFTNGEYKNSIAPIERVTYVQNGWLGMPGHTIVIGYEIEK